MCVGQSKDRSTHHSGYTLQWRTEKSLQLRVRRSKHHRRARHLRRPRQDRLDLRRQRRSSQPCYYSCHNDGVGGQVFSSMSQDLFTISATLKGILQRT